VGDPSQLTVVVTITLPSALIVGSDVVPRNGTVHVRCTWQYNGVAMVADAESVYERDQQLLPPPRTWEDQR
jgi:hypothetical protein